MGLFRRAVGEYWIAYYLFYVAIAAWGCWLNRSRLQWSQLLREDQVYLLAAIFGAAAGIALLAAIILEVTGRMVLLIPAAWNRAKAEGRAEGRVEGRAEERKRLKKEYEERYQAAYERFGIEVDGVLVLPRTPEVERFLAGGADERS